MSDGVKIMSIGCVAVCFVVAVCLIPENTNLLWGIFAALCSVIGVPVISSKVGVKVVKK